MIRTDHSVSRFDPYIAGRAVLSVVTRPTLKPSIRNRSNAMHRKAVSFGARRVVKKPRSGAERGFLWAQPQTQHGAGVQGSLHGGPHTRLGFERGNLR